MSRVVIRRLVLSAPVEPSAIPFLRARIEREVARAMESDRVAAAPAPVSSPRDARFATEVAEQIHGAIVARRPK